MSQGFLFVSFYYMYLCLLHMCMCMHVCELVPKRPVLGTFEPGVLDGCERHDTGAVRDMTQVLGFKLWSFGRTGSALEPELSLHSYHLFS